MTGICQKQAIRKACDVAGPEIKARQGDATGSKRNDMGTDTQYQNQAKLRHGLKFATKSCAAQFQLLWLRNAVGGQRSCHSGNPSPDEGSGILIRSENYLLFFQEGNKCLDGFCRIKADHQKFGRQGAEALMICVCFWCRGHWDGCG
jgi:hypothetical protein